MTRFRTFSMLIAAAVLSIAMIACTTEANGGDSNADPTATAPSNVTPGGDQPSSSEPGGTVTPPAGPALDDFDRIEVPAPIEEINVLFLESFPVQHRLHVVSGLPGGCAAFESIEVEQDGTTFIVTVTNTEPAPGQEIACTMIYGYHESTVALGEVLEVGTEYTVQVNDKVTTFVAQ